MNTTLDILFEKYEKSFNSLDSKLQIEAYNSLKQDMYILFKQMPNSNYSSYVKKIWMCIRTGLLDKNGNVRSYAFYTLKKFRSALFLYETTFDLNILEELYALALDEKDIKIKQTLLRSIIEMKCIALEAKAQECGWLREYVKIMKYASLETKEKYEKPKSKKEVLIDELGRLLFLKN